METLGVLTAEQKVNSAQRLKTDHMNTVLVQNMTTLFNIFGCTVTVILRPMNGFSR